MAEITEILRQLRTGNDEVEEDLFRAAYQDLRRIAGAQLRREQSGQTLQATALVHEVWLRLMGTPFSESVQSRQDFLCVAAEVMRRILVDIARQKSAEKRGGRMKRQQDLQPRFIVSR